MNQFVTINKLSNQLGVTSRTLRHWEEEGLYKSSRDRDSNWRAYDDEAVACIRVTLFLRKLDIPLKDIKKILEERTIEAVERAIKKKIIILDKSREEILLHKKMLSDLLSHLCEIGKDSKYPLGDMLLLNLNKREENNIMNEEKNLKVITLPPMRTVNNIAIGPSPEDEAMKPVLKWLEASGLMGTARIFGYNAKPYPSSVSPEYGFGICASIPENVDIPAHLEEKRLPGGLYAMLESSEDVYGSWQLLMKKLKERDDYTPDTLRPCLEEHIRNDNPLGHGDQFMLNLLEPVKRK